MLFLGAQTNTRKGHVICYSIWYETMHHQLPVSTLVYSTVDSGLTYTSSASWMTAENVFAHWSL